MLAAGSYDPPEPPEYGSICCIVAAETRGRAKWLALQTARDARNAVGFSGMVEMPMFAIRKLGKMGLRDEGVLGHREADPWWSMVPAVETPRPAKDWESSRALA